MVTVYTKFCDFEINRKVNVFGILTWIKSYNDLNTFKNITLRISENYLADSPSLLCNLFFEKPIKFNFEKQQILRLHRIKIESFNDEMRGVGFKGFSLLVIAESTGSFLDPQILFSYPRSSELTSVDKNHILLLQNTQVALSRSHSPHIIVNSTLSGQTTLKTYIDLNVQLIGQVVFHKDRALIFVWDGISHKSHTNKLKPTVFSENEEATVKFVQDFETKWFHLPIVLDYVLPIYVYDDHVPDLLLFQLGDYISITNVRIKRITLPEKNGNDSQLEFIVHGNGRKNFKRGLKLLKQTSESHQALHERISTKLAEFQTIFDEQTLTQDTGMSMELSDYQNSYYSSKYCNLYLPFKSDKGTKLVDQLSDKINNNISEPNLSLSKNLHNPGTSKQNEDNDIQILNVIPGSNPNTLSHTLPDCCKEYYVSATKTTHSKNAKIELLTTLINSDSINPSFLSLKKFHALNQKRIIEYLMSHMDKQDLFPTSTTQTNVPDKLPSLGTANVCCGIKAIVPNVSKITTQNISCHLMQLYCRDCHFLQDANHDITIGSFESETKLICPVCQNKMEYTFAMTLILHDANQISLAATLWGSDFLNFFPDLCDSNIFTLALTKGKYYLLIKELNKIIEFWNERLKAQSHTYPVFHGALEIFYDVERNTNSYFITNTRLLMP